MFRVLSVIVAIVCVNSSSFLKVWNTTIYFEPCLISHTDPSWFADWRRPIN